MTDREEISRGLAESLDDMDIAVAAGKRLRIQLDCASAPSAQASALIEQARAVSSNHQIRFVVNLLS